MSRKSDDELFREATGPVERTIASYRGEGRVLVGLLVGMPRTGLGLRVYGAAVAAWQMMAHSPSPSSPSPSSPTSSSSNIFS